MWSRNRAQGKASHAASISRWLWGRAAAPSWQPPNCCAAALVPWAEAVAGERQGSSQGRDAAARGNHKPSRASWELGRACAQCDALVLLIQIWSLPGHLGPGGEEGLERSPASVRHHRKLCLRPSGRREICPYKASMWKTTNCLVSR